MQIDIREEKLGKVTKIKFAEEKKEKDAFLLTLKGKFSRICTGWDEDSFVYVNSKEDAENLIKALQKAIELGNWE